MRRTASLTESLTASLTARLNAGHSIHNAAFGTTHGDARCRTRGALLSATLLPTLLLLSVSAQAQFHDHYEHISGGSTLMAAPGKSTVSVQEPLAGDILYVNTDDAGGFRLTKVSSTGAWINTWSYPGIGGQPDVEAMSLSLDTDGGHVILVGRQEGVGDDRLFVMKVQVSDGLVVWTQRIDDNGGFSLGDFWRDVIVGRYVSPDRSLVVFGTVFVEVEPDVFVRKLAGFSIDEIDGELNWSNIYLEVNVNLFRRLHAQPTDIEVRNGLAYVAAEVDTGVASRAAVFQVSASTGDLLEMNAYTHPSATSMYHPRLDVVERGDNRGLVLGINNYERAPLVALIGGGGNPVWARRITSADTTVGVFQNALLTDRLDAFVGEPGLAGIVSFDLATGALVEDHYFVTDENVVSMDRSQDHRYLLSLEQREVFDGRGSGLGFFYTDDQGIDNTFDLLYTDDPASPFACETEHTTTVQDITLSKRRLAYTWDNWAEATPIEVTATENTVVAETPCSP